jgi:hypothetical protein
MKFSTFLKHKNEMVEPSCELFSTWKHHEHPVKYIRCDNAGENKTLQKRANGVDWKLNIEFEFTPRDTLSITMLQNWDLYPLPTKAGLS